MLQAHGIDSAKAIWTSVALLSWKVDESSTEFPFDIFRNILTELKITEKWIISYKSEDISESEAH